jgi:hypothetical protein
MPQPTRTRAPFAGLALGTIAIGLLVQRIRPMLPPVAADILGDALWAMMIAWLAGALAPGLPRWKRAIGALGFCWMVEASQLYHAPELDAWRATTLGHLTLGTDFDPRDLAAYALGVLAAFLLEPVLLRGIAAVGSRPPGGDRGSRG